MREECWRTAKRPAFGIGVAWALFGLPVTAAGQTPDSVDDAGGDELLTVEHYVQVVSQAPSMVGQIAVLYARERLLPLTALRPRSLEGRVVVFVHGAGTPSEVAFDTPGASWMRYLARAGYDVFAMDMTGYGRSTRPYPMNDPCNLSEGQQQDLVPEVLTGTCEPTFGFNVTTIESDWHDLDAVVEYVRALRNIERVHLVGWSLGGPRAGGYAARHPDKVASVVLLAPAYGRDRSAVPPPEVPSPGPAMTKQSRRDFDAVWDRQLGCAGQSDPRVRESVWAGMLESDPVGATWGAGVRRAPRVTSWGWSSDEVARQVTPMLLFAPETDGQVAPERVLQLYEDLGSDHKIVAHVACSSHYAVWETNRQLMFGASLEWLESGTVGGVRTGEVRLGNEPNPSS